jgi:PPIC-type PPIASE domain
MPETFSHPSAPRRRSAAAVVLLLGLALAACGTSSDGPVGISVDSSDIPTKTINRELDAIVRNKVVASQAAVNGKIRPDIAASWLTTDVQIAVAKAAVQKAEGRVNREDRAAARKWANEHFGSEQAFAAFPDWFRAEVLRDYAFVPAYERMHSKPPTEQDLRDSYQASLDRNCASRRYVFRIVSPDEATVRAAAAQIASGADFSQVAATVSTDSGSKSRGGAIGCLDHQQVEPVFGGAANATAIGSVSVPFSTADGWQIVKVEDVGKLVPFEKVKSEIRGTLQYGADGRAALAKAMAGAKVKVDRRFGRWVVKDGVGRIEPPKSATTSSSAPGGEPSTTTAP